MPISDENLSAGIVLWGVEEVVALQNISSKALLVGKCLCKHDLYLQADKEVRVNMEDEFLSLGLDIIGLGVFNYDFGSVTKESPVIKAVYRCLNEAVRSLRLSINVCRV